MSFHGRGATSVRIGDHEISKYIREVKINMSDTSKNGRLVYSAYVRAAGLESAPRWEQLPDDVQGACTELASTLHKLDEGPAILSESTIGEECGVTEGSDEALPPEALTTVEPLDVDEPAKPARGRKS